MNTTATDSALPVLVLKWWIFGVCIAALLIGYLAMPAYSTSADHVGYMLRVTARIAFAFLLLAYVARPLQRLFGLGGALVRNRRYLGLSMALAHTVHFGYVVAFAVNGGELDAITVIFGGFAFVLMWSMAATSNDASMRLLKRNWKRLHTLGLHYLWFIFMQSFLGRVGADDPYYLYAALSAAGFAALGLRVWAYWRARA